MRGVKIVPFEQSLAPAFKALNEAWICRHFSYESKDAEILEDPAGRMVAQGGQVLFVLEDGLAVGCCALIRMGDGGFELAKMAVADEAQGRGFAKTLLAACVEWATAAGARRIYLESNASLRPALTLYRRFGFTDVPPERRPVSPYARADVWMEFILASPPGRGVPAQVD